MTEALTLLKSDFCPEHKGVICKHDEIRQLKMPLQLGKGAVVCVDVVAAIHVTDIKSRQRQGIVIPVHPEEGATASMGLLATLLPEYHMNQRCSLSPR